MDSRKTSMPFTIVLDSTFRDIDDYPNVENFSYYSPMWPRPDEKNYMLGLRSIIIPYRESILSKRYMLASITHSTDKMNHRILNGSYNPDYNRSNFVLTVQKVVGTNWIYLSSITAPILTHMSSTLDFEFKILDSHGNLLVINSKGDVGTLPENQVSVIFDLTPCK